MASLITNANLNPINVNSKHNLNNFLKLDYSIQNSNRILSFYTLEERIKHVFASFNIFDETLISDFSKKIVSNSTNVEIDYSRTHLLLEKNSPISLFRIASVPIVSETLELKGYKNILITHNKLSPHIDEFNTLNYFTEKIIKIFDGHDKNERLTHDMRVGKRTKFLMKEMINIHPSFEEIIPKNPSYIKFAQHSAMLHDIGKIFIPYEILNKPGKLTPIEWEIMKKHTHYGHLLLEEIPGLELATSVANYHHEKMDSSGYNKISGNRIPLVSRFAAISDIYDALISERAYKKAYSPEEAREIMLFGYNDGGEQFNSNSYDPHIREHLLNPVNWNRFKDFNMSLQ